MKITGHVTGTSRDDLIAQATEDAIQFFGTTCVYVQLYNAVAEKQGVEARTLWEPLTYTVFRADYVGEERHGEDYEEIAN